MNKVTAKWRTQPYFAYERRTVIILSFWRAKGNSSYRHYKDSMFVWVPRAVQSGLSDPRCPVPVIDPLACSSLSLSVTSFRLLQLSPFLIHPRCSTPPVRFRASPLHTLVPFTVGEKRIRCHPLWHNFWACAICVILSISFGSTLYQYSRTLNRHLIPSTCPHCHCRLCLLVVC